VPQNLPSFESIMTLNRRTLLTLIATALPTFVSAEEPFPVFASEPELLEYKFRRREVNFKTDHPPGSVVVDTQKFFLSLVKPEGRAIRYGIGVGRTGTRWSGEAEVARKAAWPTWTPTADMLARHANYAQWKTGMPGGPDNPLGARAIYLLNDGKDNQFRIHGTPLPTTIGQATTSGCFRMLNVDVIDLYDRVEVGTRVVVLPRVASKRTSLFGPIE
jgi:lipoprotein-anchoring transpeptidase ErfK/SrfK